MKKRIYSRIISCILVLVMLLGVVPALNASAADTPLADVTATTTGITAEGFVYEIAEDEVTITDYTGSATEVVVPSTVEGYPVTIIGEAAFLCESRVTTLEKITLPETVTSIGNDAFFSCTALADVYYGGTQVQWNEITISDGNECLTNATIYFTAESVTVPTEPETDPVETDPVEHILIYFTDVLNWDSMYLYYEYEGDPTAYPREMEWDSLSSNGHNIYIQSIPADADSIYFIGSNGERTAYIYDFAEGMGYYCTERSESGMYAVDSYVYGNSEPGTDSMEPDVEYEFPYTIDISNGQYPIVDGYNTVVFATKWDSASVYAWSEELVPFMGEWPGTSMKHALVNEYGENLFVAYIPVECDYYIINNSGRGQETVDLDISTSVGVYLAEKVNSVEYTIGTWEPLFYEYTPESDTTVSVIPTEPGVYPEYGIGAGSNVFTDANVGDKVRYTVEFSAQRLFENFEATLTYDSEYLELAALYDEDGEELTDMYDIGAVMCPNLCAPFVNSTVPGVVRLFDINLDGNDFTEEKVLLTVEFIVKDTAYSEIELTIDEMTILGGEEDYFTGGEAVITEGVSITDGLEITEKAPEPTEPEETEVYTVVFLDYDGKFIEVQIVKEGEAAVAPQAPTRKGYNFAGWDTEFENVTSNIIVKATYTKISTTPVPAPTTGTLKIEVAGGKGFSISIGGGAYRAQGASYMNSQITIGQTVAVKADTVSDATFVGWVNPNTGIVVSSDLSYTFTASGNDFFKAMFAVKVDGVQMVTFKNDKANRILDSQYYAQDEAIQFPAAPTQVGFDFAGWSMTEAEIQSAIANGEDVTVLATWTKALVPVEVTVNGGTGSGTYYANNAVTVTANEAPAGRKFAYWTDAQGNIRSYNAEYKFFPTADTTLTAVFVAEDEVIDYEILVSMDSIDTVSVADKNVFYYSWYCPEEYTFVKVGVVAVNKDNYNESTFTAGSSDGNVYDRSPSGTSLKPVNTYSWTKSNVTSGQTWMAKAYVQYKDADGTIITVYSDVVEATKE